MEYNDARTIWETALGELQIQVSKSNYKTWLDKTLGINFQNNNFIVGVPNTFVAEYLDKNQRSLIEKTLIGITHSDIKVAFKVQDAHQARKLTGTAQSEIIALNSNYTFDSFVVGTNNQLAYTAALEITEKPGQSYNPLLICGAPGLGKTHLLQAIGHQAIANHVNVLYASAEQYTNEFVSSIKERRTEDFRNKYRSAEMLLIDDLDFITGKEQTEESLFHTVNELQNACRQIAVTCNHPPQVMSNISERLRSRLAGGLIADIQSPDFETRLHILEAKAKKRGININVDVLELIATSIRQNIRELEGSLNRVIAYARLVRNDITPDIVSRALEDIAGKPAKPSALTPQLLVEAVADSFQLTTADLLSKKRDKETALARQMAMYVMKQEFNYSLAQIGQEFGGRNPATVTHACQKIAGELTSNSFLQNRLVDIEGKIDQLRSSLPTVCSDKL